ncbi:MAG: EAL and HDOD domain-containing protein [Gemmatimonadaceae bacterium]
MRFIARQPIFDFDRRLAGYELLYRDAAEAQSAPDDVGNVDMTKATMVAAILDIGLDQLTGPTPAWINVPRELLLDRSVELLDPSRVVIEILESVTPDREVVEACRSLREKGYELALDDFAGDPSYEPLLKLAHIVKIDAQGGTREALRARVDALRPHRVRLVAERIEDREQFAACGAMGFRYFQGYYFRRPEVVQRRVLPVTMLRVSKLLELVSDPRIGDQRLEDELRADPGLSVKLLRIVNSASSGHRGVSSIRHAVQLAGRRALHRWLALLWVHSSPAANDIDREAVLLALECGRFCELLAIETGQRGQAETLFLVGMLARLDAALGIPMETLVRQMGVAPEVAAALRGMPGPHTPYLELATAYASADWPTVTLVGRSMGVLVRVSALHLQAGLWARRVMQGD